MTPRPALLVLLTSALCAVAGCANYRYDVVTESGSVAAVAKDRDLVVPAAPANLRLRQVESRCVLILENPTTQPITLDGAGSTIVDPRGESRAILSQSIAPGSFVKFVLPPYDERPRINPGFQFGIGVMVDASPVDTRPAHRLQINGPKQEFWTWDGEGEIKIMFSLRQEQDHVRRQLVLRRSKQ